ncbi:HAD family hydrolase [Gottfriedia luciferensis]|uniref:HAD family hydrolase n=1 Tax=Gottfriedia luciferensis TaxID=178774 RepID=UPI000B43FFFC|nr:HAD family hydrolase [Gottfriedia luciferensis]
METKNYESILFDLDGTLTNPKEGIVNSINYALQKMNKPKLQESELLNFIGPPIQQSFSEICQLNEKEVEIAVRFYREYFSKNGMIENNVYEGIPELLEELNLNGKRLFVATSKPTIFAKQIISHFQLDHFFVEIVGSELDGTRINKAEIIDYLFLGENDCVKESTVMIGDRFHDMIGAKLNNIDSIGVTYGYGSEDELINSGANALANSVDHLKRMLLLDNKIKS